MTRVEKCLGGSFDWIESLPDRKTMEYFYRLSQSTYHGVVDGKVICCWGLIPPTILSDKVYLWLYTTTEVDKHQFILVRRSQMVIQDLLKEFSTIVGHCYIDNERGKRWIRWLGGVFGEPQGVKLPFTIRKRRWIQSV
jgi:hypothetical protein